MAVWIVPGLDLGQKTPRIGYENLLRSPLLSSLSASSQASGHPPSAVADWQTYTAWRAGTGGQTLTAVFSSAVKANYLAIYGHNLHTATGGTVQLAYSPNAGVTWYDCHPVVLPDDGGPIYIIFTERTATHWRLAIGGTQADYHQIKVAAFGRDLQLQRGAQPGFAPPSLSPDLEILGNVSAHGAPLGRSVIRRGMKTTLELRDMDEEWARSDWLPAINHAILHPFFLAWAPEDWPDEVAFCWLDDAVPPTAYSRIGYLSVALPLRGLIT